MPANNRALKVFLCHAEEDKPKVRALYRYLRSNGIDAWLDEEKLLGGQEWRVEISKAVDKADVVVVCMSSVSARKEGYVQVEIKTALEKAEEKPEGTIYIIPAKLEECVIPDKLSDRQWVNLYEGDGYGKLLAALKSRSNDIGITAPQSPTTENLATVELTLVGSFSEFSESKRDDLVGVLAALLRVDKSSIRVLRAYPGSIIVEIELTKIGANRLLNYFEKGDIRLKSLGIISVKLLVGQKTRKGTSKPPKKTNDSQFGDILKVEAGNQSIIVMGDIVGSSLISGNENMIEASKGSDGGSETSKYVSTRSEKLVADHVLEGWLEKHGLVKNPFGKVDFKSYPYYPEGATRPNQWEAFLDPDPLFGLCLNSDDAHVLSYRLRLECLPLNNKEVVGEVNHQIFPIWISHRQTIPIQSPLLTIAHSTAQAWLGILPQNPHTLLELSPAKQNAMIELLKWSYGSTSTIIDLLQRKELKEDAAGLLLIRKFEKFDKESITTPVPQDEILLSWLNVKPFDLSKTFLIFPGDDFLVATPKWWFEQFDSLTSLLIPNGIITKVITSTKLQIMPSFQEIELSWTGGLEGWLNRSLQGQFDAAMDSEEKSMGIAVRFRELFGPDAAEEQTTAKLISASHNSLARMLTFGNRLLQHHCESRIKDEEPEKYLYPADLETILNTA